MNLFLNLDFQTEKKIGRKISTAVNWTQHVAQPGVFSQFETLAPCDKVIRTYSGMLCMVALGSLFNKLTIEAHSCWKGRNNTVQKKLCDIIMEGN